MDRKTRQQTEEVLEDLEEKLLKRILDAKVRSPDTLMDEIEALDIVLSLKTRIKAV